MLMPSPRWGLQLQATGPWEACDFCLENNPALAGVALSWLKRCHLHPKVVGLIPGQGMYLGCRSDPWMGSLWGPTNQRFSLTLMFLSAPRSTPSLPLSL